MSVVHWQQRSIFERKCLHIYIYVYVYILDVSQNRTFCIQLCRWNRTVRHKNRAIANAIKILKIIISPFLYLGTLRIRPWWVPVEYCVSGFVRLVFFLILLFSVLFNLPFEAFLARTIFHCYSYNTPHISRKCDLIEEI